MVQSNLQQLRMLLNTALDVMEDEAQRSDYPDFSLEPISHPCDQADAVPSARMFQARRAALAALGQIKACIQPASDQIFENTLICYDMVSVYTCVKAGVFEVLAGKGVNPSRGLHVNDIVHRLPAESKLEPQRLSRLLRLCAASHFAKETSPNVFAMTRVSASLYVRTPSGLQKSPVYYWVDAVSRNGMKATVKAYETWTDPTLSSDRAEDAPWCRGAGFSGSFWEFLGGNPEEMMAFGIGMTGFGQASLAACLEDFDWAALGSATVVDVGGGRASFSLPLLQRNPNLKLVLQDRPEVVPEAEKFFQQAMPMAIKQGRVTFQSHDFFQPNPQVGDDKVYVLRWILHDWSDALATQILKSLEAVMTPGSRILIIDSAIVANTTDQLEGANAAEYSDALRSESAPSGRGLEAAPAPALISSNFDTASKIPLGVDVAMDCWFGGKDRTMEDLQGIVRASGLRIAHVTHTRSSQWIVELRRQ